MSAIVLDTVLPSLERCQIILAAQREGKEFGQITRLVCGDNRKAIRRLVEKVLADPAGFDPDVDEVAVDRAYWGDKDVWVALTRHERKEVVNRIMARAMRGGEHGRWPGIDVTEYGRQPGWLTRWCERVGEKPQRFHRMMDRRMRDAKAKAQQ